MEHEVGMSSEWPCASEGFIVFKVSEPAWGIELLRDGDHIPEPCKHFLPRGQYHQSILEGSLMTRMVSSVVGVLSFYIIFIFAYYSWFENVCRPVWILKVF